MNRDAVSLLDRMRDSAGLDTFLISGCLGPRGDGYIAGEVVEPDKAAAYHAPQIEALAEAGVDLVTVLTLTGTGEAIGVVRAARAAGLPVAVSFTVEIDGRLPDGTPLATAVTEVDAEGGPDYFMVKHLDAAVELFSEAHELHPETPEIGRGPEAMKQAFAGLHEQFPDVRVTIDSMAAEADVVAVRLTFTGTDAATGERVTWPEMVFTRFSAGKAAESWEITDTGRSPDSPAW